MATIVDVAKRAGVSIKTVSRVLNKASNVRDGTATRVREAISALDYQPSSAARELRSGRSRFIGMVFAEPSTGFEARLYQAALRAVGDAGYFLAAGLIDEVNPDWRGQLRDFLDRSRTTTMVLTPPFCDSEDLLAELAEREVQTVLISPSVETPNTYTVRMDDYLGAIEVTNHLISLGHVRLGHLTGPQDHVASSLRRRGFEAAIAASETTSLNPNWIKPGHFRFKDALSAAEAILSGPDRPTAIFAANDESAAAVCFAAGRMGLSVPGDLSVAGFDDAPIATTVWPPLTTIAQPFDAMAEAIVDLLSAPGDTQTARQGPLILPHQLKERSSTAPPSVK